MVNTDTVNTHPGDEGDFWQQGGNPVVYIQTFITMRARERAINLDKRTVYRKRKYGGLEEVGVFAREKDAQSVVIDHNASIQEKVYKPLHDRLDALIDRLGSDSIGDPIL